jgi:hypothetical protein
MNNEKFKKMMLRADTLRGVAFSQDDIEFWAGYMRGLRKKYHGDSFGTDKEHEAWFSIPADTPDLQRRARGIGYRAGLAGLDPVELFRSMNEAMSARDLATATGKTSSHIRRLARKIPGGRQLDTREWRFPNSAVEWIGALPKPGPKKKTKNSKPETE